MIVLMILGVDVARSKDHEHDQDQEQEEESYPAWIRTMNNASKGRCVTVTPRGNPILDLRLPIFDFGAR
jgi:hypothetical protein